MEVERTIGTSKLIAIILRWMGARVGDLRLTLEKSSCWLRSRSCSTESPPERENVKDWSLRVEDERFGEIYL